MNIKVNGRYYPVVEVKKIDSYFEVQYKHSRGVSSIVLKPEQYEKQFGTAVKKKKKPKEKNVLNSPKQREFAQIAQAPLSPKLHDAQVTDLIGFRYNNQALIGVVDYPIFGLDDKRPREYIVRAMSGRGRSRLVQIKHEDVLAIIPQLRLPNPRVEYQYGYDVNLDYGIGFVTSWEDRTFTDGYKRDVRKMHLRSTVKRLIDLLGIKPEVCECYPILNG